MPTPDRRAGDPILIVANPADAGVGPPPPAGRRRDHDARGERTVRTFLIFFSAAADPPVPTVRTGGGWPRTGDIPCGPNRIMPGPTIVRIEDDTGTFTLRVHGKPCLASQNLVHCNQFGPDGPVPATVLPGRPSLAPDSAPPPARSSGPEARPGRLWTPIH